MAQDESFRTALEAELEAVVARYEALAKAHHEALVQAQEQKALALQGQLAAAEREHEALKKTAVAERAELLSDKEELTARVAALQAEKKVATSELAKHQRAAAEERDKLLAEKERLSFRVTTLETKVETVERERNSVNAAAAQLRAQKKQLEEQVAELSQKLSEATEALEQERQRARTASSMADELSEDMKVLADAFAKETAFVAAAAELAGTKLGRALEQALGRPLGADAATYAELKAARPDVVLTHAFKSRGRRIVTQPLGAEERAALDSLAAAAGCELIEPELGTRFSSLSMDKADTAPDPAEADNVLECLMPGLRLAGSDGSLVFPRVRVAEE